MLWMTFLYHIFFAYKFTNINYSMINMLKAISGCSDILLYWLKIIINNKTTATSQNLMKAVVGLDKFYKQKKKKREHCTDISGDAYA